MQLFFQCLWCLICFFLFFIFFSISYIYIYRYSCKIEKSRQFTKTIYRHEEVLCILNVFSGSMPVVGMCEKITSVQAILPHTTLRIMAPSKLRTYLSIYVHTHTHVHLLSCMYIYRSVEDFGTVTRGWYTFEHPICTSLLLHSIYDGIFSREASPIYTFLYTVLCVLFILSLPPSSFFRISPSFIHSI